MKTRERSHWRRSHLLCEVSVMPFVCCLHTVIMISGMFSRQRTSKRLPCWVVSLETCSCLERVAPSPGNEDRPQFRVERTIQVFRRFCWTYIRTAATRLSIAPGSRYESNHASRSPTSVSVAQGKYAWSENPAPYYRAIVGAEFAGVAFDVLVLAQSHVPTAKG